MLYLAPGKMQLVKLQNLNSIRPYKQWRCHTIKLKKSLSAVSFFFFLSFKLNHSFKILNEKTLSLKG